MPKNTSVTLGEHFEAFNAEQIKTGKRRCRVFLRRID